MCQYVLYVFFFFFQAEDGIRDRNVTGVQTCALPICLGAVPRRKRGPAARDASLDRAAPGGARPQADRVPERRRGRCRDRSLSHPRGRSEERRVGKECRARGALGRGKKKTRKRTMERG